MQITRKEIVFYLWLMFIFSGVLAAKELDLSLFEVKKLNDNVYVMSQDYGISKINFAIVIGVNEVALITAMMNDFSEHIQLLIKGITDKEIEYVFSLDGDYYQYNGSRHFVENGATFVARENLIPDAFANRIFVSSRKSFDLKTESITAIPTTAHTENHMMLTLKKSNVMFAGDAVGFDWIVYSGANGPHFHIAALKEILRLSDDETKIFPGNWSSKQYGNKDDLAKLIDIYSKFVDQVILLSSHKMTPEEIAAEESIHSLLRNLNAYQRQKENIVYYVKDVLGPEICRKRTKAVEPANLTQLSHNTM